MLRRVDLLGRRGGARVCGVRHSLVARQPLAALPAALAAPGADRVFAALDRLLPLPTEPVRARRQAGRQGGGQGGGDRRARAAFLFRVGAVSGGRGGGRGGGQRHGGGGPRTRIRRAALHGAARGGRAVRRDGRRRGGARQGRPAGPAARADRRARHRQDVHRARGRARLAAARQARDARLPDCASRLCALYVGRPPREHDPPAARVQPAGEGLPARQAQPAARRRRRDRRGVDARHPPRRPLPRGAARGVRRPLRGRREPAPLGRPGRRAARLARLAASAARRAERDLPAGSDGRHRAQRGAHQLRRRPLALEARDGGAARRHTRAATERLPARARAQRCRGPALAVRRRVALAARRRLQLAGGGAGPLARQARPGRHRAAQPEAQGRAQPALARRAAGRRRARRRHERLGGGRARHHRRSRHPAQE
mmetsp:Transcript_30418/g.92748  ORF Transcript_30418/g.92748 Transcript_30418/m.92748 type:complete len:428 (+) Transcript_30418:94-1377(+)